MTVVLSVDPGTINLAVCVLSSSGEVLHSRHYDGHMIDTFTCFCDELSRTQRKYGRTNVTVAVEDAVSHGSAKAGLFKLVALVGGIQRWSECKGCPVVTMRRVDVLRFVGLKGKVPKKRSKLFTEKLLRHEFETDHEADAALLGWVVGRKLLARVGRRSA